MVTLTRGERFKDAREVHSQHGKQTMEVVAKATGVSKSLIHSLEDDESTRSVGYDKIAKLAAYYGVSCDYLLGLSPNPTIDKDLDAVCKYTGLSEQAVKALKAAQACINNDPNCVALIKACYSCFSGHSNIWSRKQEEDVGGGIIDFIDAVICALTEETPLLHEIITMYQEALRELQYGNPDINGDLVSIDQEKGTITIPTILFKELTFPSIATDLTDILKKHYSKNKGRS